MNAEKAVLLGIFLFFFASFHHLCFFTIFLVIDCFSVLISVPEDTPLFFPMTATRNLSEGKPVFKVCMFFV